jgi:hypothetical protein
MSWAGSAGFVTIRFHSSGKSVADSWIRRATCETGSLRSPVRGASAARQRASYLARLVVDLDERIVRRSRFSS